MKKTINGTWLPTPTFLYRNYLYLKLVNLLPKKIYFLDVGAGNGQFIKHLLKMGFTGESIDISRDAVLFARKGLLGAKGIQIKQGNIFTYKSKKKYDVVFCFEVLEHIKDDTQALKKIFALLNPGGQFIMSVPAHMSKWSTIDDIKGHYRRYEKQELIKKIELAGFKVNKIMTYGFPFLNIVRQISKSGRYVHSKTQHLNKDARGMESSIQQEYNPKLKILINNKLFNLILFKIMNLFLHTDLGLGYVTIAKKLP